MKKKVLLVEDEVLLAMAKQQEFAVYNYETAHVTTGEKAIELISQGDEPIDLILMDIDLGSGIDGTEAARQILEFKEIPIVFLSSHEEPEIVEKTEKITSYGYVVKSSSFTVLDASIKMAFKLHESRIREREKEKELSRNEEKLSLAMDAAEHGFWDWNITTDEAYFSPRWYTMLGYEPGELPMSFDTWVDLLHPDSMDAIEHVNQHAQNAEPFNEEFQLRCKDRSYKWIRGQGKSYEFDKEKRPTRVVGIHIDITEKKQAEIKAAENERNLSAILNNTDDIVVRIDRDLKHVFANSSLFNATGLIPKKYLGKTNEEIGMPEHLCILWREKHQKVFASGKPEYFEFIYPTKHEGEKTFQAAVSPEFNDNNEVVTIVSFMRDITKLKNAENDLRKTQKELEEQNRFIQKIVDNLPIGLAVNYFDKGTATYMNRQFEKIYGWSKKELQDIPNFFKKVYPDPVYRQKIQTQILQDIESRDPKRMQWDDIEVTAKDGSKRIISATNIPIFDQNFMISTVQDVTDRKKSEESLKNSLIDLKLAQNIANVGNWQFDPKSGITTWSDQVYAIYNRNLEQEPPQIDEYKRIHGPEQLAIFNTAFQHAIKEGTPYDIILKLNLPGGIVKWIRTICDPDEKKGEAGHFLRGTIQEITELKQAEAELRATLDEKDYLMKELNHRVKNNLLILSSLINLKDSETEIDLSDLQHQVEAIGLLHEKLYQNNSITDINCKDYFGDLLKSIFSSSNKQEVRRDDNIEDMHVPTKTAMTLGLIINEIATNAIKHGFTDNKKAVFSMTMEEDKENNNYKLVLSNSGSPFPADIDFDNSETLGLRLISALVGQLEGTIGLQREPHPVFTIRFPLEVT